jgi:hypothetical protein
MTTPKVPEDITITYFDPSGSTTDITGSVTYIDAYFELQAAAVPGSFHLTVKDPNHTMSFVSGGRIEMSLGTVKMFGGFLTQVTRDFFFSALDTSEPVKGRRWSLDGVDYNYILDKRVLRRPADYTHKIPDVALANANDAHIISLFSSYFDLGFSGGGSLDVTTKVEHVNDFSVKYVWPMQGETMRAVLDSLVIETTIHGELACIYWVDADADLNWLALQTTAAPWGFSDIPNGTTFIGWRDGTVTDDGSSVINEVFVWGGSPIGTNGSIVLAHKSNSTSITDNGRWQLAENHPGEDRFKTQAQVDARANALISGSTSGTSPVTGAQGLVNPDRQFVLTWFSHDVPKSLGVRQQLIPGMVTTFNLWSFSEDDGVTPYVIAVPLRQVKITFPTLPGDNPDSDPLTFVQFEGTFGLQMSDPVWWWQFLRKMRPMPQPAPVVGTDNDSSTFPYGSYFADETQEAANGSRTLFSILPPYISGTLQVYTGSGGSLTLLTKDVAWSETNPDVGSFTLVSAPAIGITVYCQARTA